MFASSSSARSSSANAAADQVKAWEASLGLRISLQRSLDLGNRLPHSSDDELPDTTTARKSVAGQLEGLLFDLTEMLEIQTEESEGPMNSGKRKRASTEVAWKRIEEVQGNLRNSWETTVNKWHARVHFGSEQVKSKMKIFNQTIWQQIDVALEDDSRVIEKSRPLWGESRRMEKDADPSSSFAKLGRKRSFDGDGDDDDDTGRQGRKRSSSESEQLYDLECYDDRPFYSLLLKSFIESSASASGSDGGMRGEDLEALRKYKRSKTNVDRKASKGRKIRYTRHPKLENFMFPVSLATLGTAGQQVAELVSSDYGSGSAGIDGANTSRFFQSLFQ